MVVKLNYSDRFKKDYNDLDDVMKDATDEALRKFMDNPRHPSLKARKMEGYKNVWEARVNSGYRFTYIMEKGGIATLRQVGPHDTLKNP